MAQQRETFGRQRLPFAGGHPHQIFLLDLRVLADQLLGDAAVLRQHQQAHRIDVEAPGRHQAAQVPRVVADIGAVLVPAVLRLHEHIGRLVAILSLPADIAHRLVDQHRDLLCLLNLRRADRP